MNDCLTNQFINCVKQSKLASNSYTTIHHRSVFLSLTTLSFTLIRQIGYSPISLLTLARQFGYSPKSLPLTNQFLLKSDLYNLPSPMTYFWLSFTSYLFNIFILNIASLTSLYWHHTWWCEWRSFFNSSLTPTLPCILWFHIPFDSKFLSSSQRLIPL